MAKAKKTDDETKRPNMDPDRMKLLAMMASSVAGGVISAPSKSTVSAKAVATIALDISEEILGQIGL
jgi:hypothetical protein